MGTIASLVTQLVMQTGQFMKGLGDAESRFGKFQKTMVGKAGMAFIGLTALKNGLDAVADATEKSVYEGENFITALQGTATEFLKNIPIAGAFARIGISLRDALLGDAAALKEMEDRLKSVQSRLGLTAAESKRLETSMAVLKKLENAVKNFGENSDIAMLKAAGATDKAILKAMILQGQLETLQRIQENQAAVDAMVSGLEEQVALFGKSAMEIDLYKAAMLGASAADLEYIRLLHEKLDAMKAIEEAQRKQNALMDEGKRITESVRTAQEVYNDTIKHLQELLEAGAISEETFRRAMAKAKEDLDKALQVDEPKTRAGSASDKFQSPAAIERRFGAGMPTGLSSQDPTIKLQKTAEQAFFDGRKRTTIQQQSLDQLKVLSEKMPQFTFFGGLN